MEGDRAEDQWTYLQALAFDGQAMWTAGRYRIDFLRVDGAWKIYIFASRTSSSWLKPGIQLASTGLHSFVRT